jgi:hypothetical protein
MAKYRPGLLHEISYYGDDKYDLGTNRVISTKPSNNPFDDEAFDSLIGATRVQEEEMSPRTSFDEGNEINENTSPAGKLRRLNSLSRLTPSVRKLLTTKLSWTKLEEGLGDQLSESSQSKRVNGILRRMKSS